MGNPLVNTYDREAKKIKRLQYAITDKYSKLPATEENLRRMTNETTQRFADIGFKVSLVIDEKNGYFTFEIISRTEKHDFDIEEKIWEVKKAKEADENVEEL